MTWTVLTKKLFFVNSVRISKKGLKRKIFCCKKNKCDAFIILYRYYRRKILLLAGKIINCFVCLSDL